MSAINLQSYSMDRFKIITEVTILIVVQRRDVIKDGDVSHLYRKTIVVDVDFLRID